MMAKKRELDDYELIIEREGKDKEVKRPLLDLTETTTNNSDTDSSDWELDSKKEEVRSNLTRDSPFSFGEADASSNGRGYEANGKSSIKTPQVPSQQKEAYEEELFDESIFSEVGSTEEAENIFDDLTDEEILGKKVESKTEELHPNVSLKIAQATELQVQEKEVQNEMSARTIKLQVPEPNIKKESSEKTVELKSLDSPDVLCNDVVAVDVSATFKKDASQLNGSIVLNSSPNSLPATPLKKGRANLAKKSAEENFNSRAFTAKPSDFSSDDDVSDSSVEYLESE